MRRQTNKECFLALLLRTFSYFRCLNRLNMSFIKSLINLSATNRDIKHRLQPFSMEKKVHHELFCLDAYRSSPYFEEGKDDPPFYFNALVYCIDSQSQEAFLTFQLSIIYQCTVQMFIIRRMALYEIGLLISLNIIIKGQYQNALNFIGVNLLLLKCQNPQQFFVLHL
ncbi:hypothetical protein FGO68_gene16704 [Halteria grandinella]|uniref:Uncharacterized protein n=1 Tax=Halteria grandinella TaxID=5974 RepID=A0A8J8P607_HALGN|nr:hypothetical protein FGO68_gene16704 [Halteria grandinella]